MDASVPVLTIDGPSGSGKGTISRIVAQRLGWHYLDSGALYRAVGNRRGEANTLAAQSELLIDTDANRSETLLEQAADLAKVALTLFVGKLARFQLPKDRLGISPLGQHPPDDARAGRVEIEHLAVVEPLQLALEDGRQLEASGRQHLPAGHADPLGRVGHRG